MPLFPLTLQENQVIIALNGKPRVVSINPDELIHDVYPDAVYVTGFPVWETLDSLMSVVDTVIARYAVYANDF